MKISLHPESAFPTQYKNPGMTLRDYFAAKALAGILVRNFPNQSFHNTAEFAYQYADAMLRVRQSPQESASE